MAAHGGTRTQEQIENALIRSKLNLTDILPVTQILKTTTENYEKEHYKLLELDSHLLESLTVGQKVAFKGDDDDNIILCTETKTYDIRECETSNSLIMVSDLVFHKDLKDIEEKKISDVNIVGLNYKYMEVLPCKPQISKLIKILETTKYQGPENEYLLADKVLLSYDELLERAQASDTELNIALEKLNVININNKLRILDFEYRFRVVSFMLQSIEENSWALDEINKEETVTAWKEIVPVEVLIQVFEIYTTPSKMSDGVQLYQYDERKICQFLASVLLHHATKFSLSDFLDAWKDSVPEGMVPTEDMLYGMAIIDRAQEPHSIWEFPEHKLPETIDGRFQALFKAKCKWTVPEITPYVQVLTTDKLDANGILAKYARASTIDGVRHYSAKYI